MAVNLCLGAVLWRELAIPHSLPKAKEAIGVSEHKEQGQTDLAKPFSLPGLEHFHDVMQHSLFSPDRRPAQGSSEPTNELALAGIITTPVSRQALVLHGKPAMLSHIEEGQTIDGWTVKSIKPDHVIFRSQTVDRELRLFADSSNTTQASHAFSAPASASDASDGDEQEDTLPLAPLAGRPTPPEP